MPSNLKEYDAKRNFDITSEPKGKIVKSDTSKLVFCVQKHDATRLHYDFRLELDGVLKSWAVTKGPSFDPHDKRLSVQVEDHPYDYRTFEGVIPPNQYGSGPVLLWDEGTWTPVNDPHEGLKKGHLTFMMDGKRLKGEWALIRMRRRPGDKHDNWLLVKASDEYALSAKDMKTYLDRENTSVRTGRTIDEIRGDKKSKQWGSSRPPKPETKATPASRARAKAQSSKPVSASSGNMPGVEALMKSYASPQLATLVEHPPAGAGWVHELKYDGYRLMAFIADGKAVLRTRGGLDWTSKFQKLADELATLNVTSAVLDGEAVVMDDRGVTNFSMLKNALSNNDQDAMHLFLFDLIHLDGRDYVKEPLNVRKEALLTILKDAERAHLHYSDHMESDEAMLPKVCELGGEGIISKRIEATYKFSRSKDWLKSKCGQEQEFVIGGFVPASDNPKAIGSLHLGFYRGGKLSHAGKVGTGFNNKTAKQIFDLLTPLARDTMPFEDNKPKGERNVVWVEPKTLCQVAFWEWTPDRHIRHASFKGLREDKKAADVVQELPDSMPEPAAGPKKPAKTKSKAGSDDEALVLDGIKITHPDRVMFPDSGVTKGELAQYYHDAMDYVMPLISGRPISVIRFPGDITGEAFFQRNPMKGVSEEVQAVTFNYKDVKRTYFYVDSANGLMSLVQMGAIEFHPWGVKASDVHHPDQLIFDLDPAEDVPFEAVKLSALDMNQRFTNMGLESFVRTTGGKGLHVIVPITPHIGWEEAKDWAREFCEQMVKDVPDAYIANMSKAKRPGKIFLDFFRNDYTATAVSAFVVRGRKGAPVAVPLDWSEVEGLDSAAHWNIRNIRERFTKRTRELIDAQRNCQQLLPNL